MKKFILLTGFFIISMTAFSQGNYQVVQQQKAHYPAGDAALQEYYNINLKYSDAALEKRLYGSVMLSFDVMADSSVSEIVVLSGVGYGVDEEVVKLLKPLKFAPAVSNGVAFKSNMIISITIKALPRPELQIEK
jgi:protein TonB